MITDCQCTDRTCARKISVPDEEQRRVRNLHGNNPSFVHPQCEAGQKQGKLIEHLSCGADVRSY